MRITDDGKLADVTKGDFAACAVILSVAEKRTASLSRDIAEAVESEMSEDGGEFSLGNFSIEKTGRDMARFTWDPGEGAERRGISVWP